MNGLEVGLIREVGSSHLRISLRQGSNELKLLVQNMGRLNFSPYLGESKGLFDTVYLDGSALDLRRGWTSKKQATIHLDQVTDLEEQTTIKRSFQLQGYDRAILVGAISVPLYINGKEVPMDGYHNWFAYKSVDISDYVNQGENDIEMPLFNAPIERLQLLTYAASAKIQGWHMAGLDHALSDEQCVPLKAGLPAWHKCEFKMPTVAQSVNIRLKLRLTGMSKGTVHLNGKDLGRYWQIGPQEDYKIPLSWLEERNELILFDEAGCSPDKVQLLYDEQSSNTWMKLDS